jgi:hypothetical protein
MARAAEVPGWPGRPGQTLAESVDDRLIHALTHSFGVRVSELVSFGMIHGQRHFRSPAGIVAV